MRTRCHAIPAVIAVILTLALAAVAPAEAPKKGLLEQLGLPAYPGAKVLREINWPAGKLLDEIAKEFGKWLGLKELNQVSLLVYRTDADQEPEQILKFYDPAFQSQEWKTMAKRLNGDDGTAILYNEKKGMIIMFVGPRAGREREFTIARLFGALDPSKIGDPSGKLPELFGKMFPNSPDDEPMVDIKSASDIPIGRPISIPPSEKLHVVSTRSAVNAVIVSGSTAQVQPSGRAKSAGELSRVDERLVLALEPRLAVDQIAVPSDYPVLFEPTGGSLSVTAEDRPERLTVVSVNAPVTVKDLPLVSGAHMVKATAAGIMIDLSQVQGGELVLSATGDDIEITVPKGASAQILAHASGGSVENLTSVRPEVEEKDNVKMVMGSGKARITIEAVNGSILIKTTD